MSSKTREETETSFWQNAADRNTWEVFTEDEYWITRLEKAGAVLVGELSGGGRRYTIRGNQLGLRKGQKKPMSDERKAQLAARMRSMRETLNAMDETKLTDDSVEMGTAS